MQVQRCMNTFVLYVMCESVYDLDPFFAKGVQLLPLTSQHCQRVAKRRNWRVCGYTACCQQGRKRSKKACDDYVRFAVDKSVNYF